MTGKHETGRDEELGKRDRNRQMDFSDNSNLFISYYKARQGDRQTTERWTDTQVRRV